MTQAAMHGAAVSARRDGASRLWRLLQARPTIGTDTLALLASLFFALACNAAFWRAAMAGRPAADPQTWLFAAAMLAGLVALHLLLLALVLHRRIAKPLLALLFFGSALATYYMQAYGIYLDPTMLRNVLRTDPKEAGELLGWPLLPHLLLYGLVPTLIVCRLNLRRRPLGRALAWRAGTIALAIGLLVAALLSVFADFSALMRNQRDLRYLITPANYLYSLARVGSADARMAERPRTPVGTDARLGPSWAQRTKPVMFVLVVGETARAANWGLDGYARQTTPELAARGVINFSHTTSCGTNTETSLPCMFSQVGRRDYDEARIRGSESLLDVLARAGFEVLWRDNQSGCKGVCAGVKSESFAAADVPGLCAEGRCFDGILPHGLDTVARDAKGNVFVVLHMLGNHGPAYFRRYPPSFKRFTPACETDEVRQCSREQIVNAYDNAILYTDHVLAGTIDWLKGQAANYDSALYYVSDHGESLGENGLYLHGMPYAIAPSEQTHVPMVWWLSPGFARSFGIDTACVAAHAAAPSSHDQLFHSVLGLLDVSTSAYDKDWDLSLACRGAMLASTAMAGAPPRSTLRP